MSRRAAAFCAVLALGAALLLAVPGCGGCGGTKPAEPAPPPVATTPPPAAPVATAPPAAALAAPPFTGLALGGFRRAGRRLG